MSSPIVALYEGNPVQFDADGWFNATAPAKRFGKRPGDWLNDETTVSYLVALAEALGLPGNCGARKQLNEINGLSKDSAATKAKILRLSKSLGLVRVRAGSPESGGGTWMHPKLAVRFAQWLDLRFAVWCDLQIDKIIRDGFPVVVDRPSTVREREPVLVDALLIMTRHRISLPYVYRGLAHYAGAQRLRDLTAAQVDEAHSFGLRLLRGQDTGADWRRLHHNRDRLNAGQRSLDLAPSQFVQLEALA